jgi:hypothetical protein
MQRIACFAHTLQLVIKDGLETTERGFVKKIQDITSASHQCSSFAEKLDAEFKLSIPSIGITRWNSHFDNVRRLNRLNKDKLNQILGECHYISLKLTNIDKEKLIDYIKIFQRFSEASIKSQAENVPTLSLVATSVVLLREHLNHVKKDIKHFKAFIGKLNEKLVDRFAGIFIQLDIVPVANFNKKYHGNFNNDIFLTATLLDLRFKLSWLDSIIKNPIITSALLIKLSIILASNYFFFH